MKKKESEGEDETGYWKADPATSGEIRLLIERALQQIESNGIDSKLAAFGALIERLDGAEAPGRRVCVITDYVATLYYLAAEIEARQTRYHIFHGGMTSDARGSALDNFRRGGGILLATTAAMTAAAPSTDAGPE